MILQNVQTLVRYKRTFRLTNLLAQLLVKDVIPPITATTVLFSKSLGVKFGLDCQALYYEPLARVIVQEIPVFDIEFAFTFLHLKG